MLLTFETCFVKILCVLFVSWPIFCLECFHRYVQDCSNFCWALSTWNTFIFQAVVGCIIMDKMLSQRALALVVTCVKVEMACKRIQRMKRTHKTDEEKAEIQPPVSLQSLKSLLTQKLSCTHRSIQPFQSLACLLEGAPRLLKMLAWLLQQIFNVFQF